MEMSGERLIVALRCEVWQALNDAAILRDCIPGCEKMDRVSETELTATAKVKIGPMSARFAFKIVLSNIDAPNGYRIGGEGQGGAAGFVKGGADVRLEDRDGATLLTYLVSAQVGGKMAQIGARLIDGTAKSLADQFFSSFAEKVGTPPVQESKPPVEPDAPTAPNLVGRLKNLWRKDRPDQEDEGPLAGG